MHLVVDNSVASHLIVAMSARKFAIPRASAIQLLMSLWKKDVDKDAWSQEKTACIDVRLIVIQANLALMNPVKLRWDIIANVGTDLYSQSVNRSRIDSLWTVMRNAGSSRETRDLLMLLAHLKSLKRTRIWFSSNISLRICWSLLRVISSLLKTLSPYWQTLCCSTLQEVSLDSRDRSTASSLLTFMSILDSKCAPTDVSLEVHQSLKSFGRKAAEYQISLQPR